MVRNSIAETRKSPSTKPAVKTPSDHKVGVFTGALTLIGTIIGGGVVGLPYAVLKTGLIFGLILNVANAVGGIYAVKLLIRAKNITGLASYSELGFACFGRASIFVINALVALATAGMPIAYFMIFGHICGPLLEEIFGSDSSFWTSSQFSQIILGILLFYFCIQKQIAEVKIAGVILFTGIIGFCIILAA